MNSVARMMAGRSASITAFKANPNAVLEQSGGEVVAVLKSNQPYFYVVPPQVFESMLDTMEDQALLAKAEARLNDGKEPIEVSLDDL